MPFGRVERGTLAANSDADDSPTPFPQLLPVFIANSGGSDEPDAEASTESTESAALEWASIGIALVVSIFAFIFISRGMKNMQQNAIGESFIPLECQQSRVLTLWGSEGVEEEGNWRVCTITEVQTLVEQSLVEVTRTILDCLTIASEECRPRSQFGRILAK